MNLLNKKQKYIQSFDCITLHSFSCAITSDLVAELVIVGNPTELP